LETIIRGILNSVKPVLNRNSVQVTISTHAYMRENDVPSSKEHLQKDKKHYQVKWLKTIGDYETVHSLCW